MESERMSSPRRDTITVNSDSEEAHEQLDDENLLRAIELSKQSGQDAKNATLRSDDLWPLCIEDVDNFIKKSVLEKTELGRSERLKNVSSFNNQKCSTEEVDMDLTKLDGQERKAAVGHNFNHEEIIHASSTTIAEIPKSWLSIMQKWMLKFGFTRYRAGQEMTMRAVLDDYDTLSIMPTANGKTLCFIIPGLVLRERLRGGVVIIVCPTIAICEQHTVDINRRCESNIAMYVKTAEECEAVIHGDFTFILLGPETLDHFADAAKFAKLRINLLVIDEVHLVMDWGNPSFRPMFRNCSKLRRLFLQDNITFPILALTASLRLDVEETLLHLLEFRAEKTWKIRLKSRRQNITLRVFPKTSHFKDICHLVAIIKETGGSGIIYRKTRKGCAQTKKILDDLPIQERVPCEIYCGAKEGSSADELTQHRIQNEIIKRNFMTGNIKIVIATVSFGMGIDKSDCRVVANYDAMSSLQETIQMAGRGGRDGLPSEHILFHEPNDHALTRLFIDKLTGEDRENADRDLKELQEYVNNTESCRSCSLYGPFDGISASPCHNCDNCIRKASQSEVEEQKNIAFEVALACASILKLNGRYGIVKIIKYMRGGKSKDVRKLAGFESNPSSLSSPVSSGRPSHDDSNDEILDQDNSQILYGKGVHLEEMAWKRIFSIMENRGYITQKLQTATFKRGSRSYFVPCVTEDGMKLVKIFENDEKQLPEIRSHIQTAKPTKLKLTLGIKGALIDQHSGNVKFKVKGVRFPLPETRSLGMLERLRTMFRSCSIKTIKQVISRLREHGKASLKLTEDMFEKKCDALITEMTCLSQIDPSSTQESKEGEPYPTNNPGLNIPSDIFDEKMTDESILKGSDDDEKMKQKAEQQLDSCPDDDEIEVCVRCSNNCEAPKFDVDSDLNKLCHVCTYINPLKVGEFAYVENEFFPGPQPSIFDVPGYVVKITGVVKKKRHIHNCLVGTGKMRSGR
jgi:ATP-dependent DNA helicase RecQ